MKLTDKLAKKILKSMFYKMPFEFTISVASDKIILFDIDGGSLTCENNQQKLLLKEKSENYKILLIIGGKKKLLGYYYIGNNMFIPSENFWKLMFVSHLK